VAHEAVIASIKQRLVEQLTSPVRWSQSMAWAVANLQGEYMEMAPGKVLSGLMRRIDKGTRVANFAQPQ
jgi:[acyl-carrier-protein] S-malonyltransferase